MLALLHRLFGADAFTDVEEPYGMLTVTTTRERIHDIIAGLQQDQELQLNFLTTMCGMHWPEREGEELGMVYMLHSLVHNIRLRLKIFFPIADPVVPTMTVLYGTANWMEREAYDFYGILFPGHPNLIRILNVEDMDYYPMRKEYALEDGTREDKTDLFFGR
ncbi:NADH dehydrogenase [Hymenobacter sp. DG25B]|nr:NADH dehydrogenase [Hymenobacter sp. DG25B]